MKNKFHPSLTLLLLMGCCLLQATYSQQSVDPSTCIHDESTFRCVQYVRNYDGDTVTFNIPSTHPIIGKEMPIRVLGVDTPEINPKQKCQNQDIICQKRKQCEKNKATVVRDSVKSLLEEADRIDLVNIERGKYFRIVADVIVDGMSLTHYLLNRGFAYSYSGRAKKTVDWCKSLD